MAHPARNVGIVGYPIDILLHIAAHSFTMKTGRGHAEYVEQQRYILSRSSCAGVVGGPIHLGGTIVNVPVAT